MPVTIQNGDIRNKISEDIKATNPGLIANLLTDYVVPMININDQVYYAKESFAFNGTAINATSTTLFTTDSVKDTYISAITLGVIKDATATSLLSTVSAVINGQTRALVSIPGITLTVQSEVVSASFNPPIKVDRSSIVTLTNSTNTGNVSASGNVAGFLRLRS